MPDIRAVQVQTAIGGAQSIEISGPENPTGLSTISLAATLADGTTLTRIFTGVHDPYQDRNGVDHPGGTLSYSSVLGIDDAALDTPIGVELITSEERGPNRYDTDPYPLTAVLGDGLDLNDLCENLMPTRLVVAERALDVAGFDLVVREGDGLPFLDEQVDREYRTVGKTPRRVLQDMLLETQPRTWYTSDAVHVDGRALPAGSPPAFTYATRDSSIERGANPEEPVPPIDAAEVTSSYELAQEYTLEWTEEAGDQADHTYTLTSYRIEKVAGAVTEEHTTVYGYLKRATNLENPSTWYWSWEKLYESSAWHTYHPLSSKALVHSSEVVRVANAAITAWEGDPIEQEDSIQGKIADLHDFIATQFGMVETRRHAVYQTWHAEGWLRSKTEETVEPGVWVVENDDTQGGHFVYRRLKHREVYTPIGQGLWNVQTTDTIPSEKVVHLPLNPNAVEGDLDYGVTSPIYTYPVENVSTQHVVTDGSPPSVTINADPCDERSDYEIEVDEYNREVAVRAAILHNQPDKRVDTFTIPGLAFEYEVGMITSGALVAAVDHQVDTDSESASTTVTFWRAYS